MGLVVKQRANASAADLAARQMAAGFAVVCAVQHCVVSAPMV
jgi:hypothetical protein